MFSGNIDHQGVKKSDSKSKKNDNNGVKKKKTRWVISVEYTVEPLITDTLINEHLQ
jgi:hypothetical protein